MIPTIFKPLRILTAVTAAMLVCPLTVLAQSTGTGKQGILPARLTHAPEYEVQSPGEETHPMVRLTPDEPQIVHLDSDARSIIVGNPAHLNVIMDSVRSLVLVPRDPGATHMTVIGKDGKVIMERYVVVAGPAEKYIRIRRTCAGAGGNSASCAETSVYYCPDMCYETKILSSTLGQQTPPGMLPGSSAQASPQDTSSQESGAGAEQPPPPEPDTENSDTSAPEGQ